MFKISFISLTCLISLARANSTMIIKVVRVDILILFLILRKSIQTFHHPHQYHVNCGYFYWCLLSDWRISLWLLVLLFLHGCVLYFVKCFWGIYWEYHVIFIIYTSDMVYNTNWFSEVRSHLSCGVNPTWPCCIIILICCYIHFASVSLRSFTSIVIGDIHL